MTPFLLVACNSYEVFRVTGYEQANFSNDADIVFVIDNSTSMEEENAALTLNIDSFIEKLAGAEGSDVPRATLTDAVGNYLRETSGEGLFIDFQLGITTTSVDYGGDNGPTAGVDPGEAGLFIGEVIRRDDSDPAEAFKQQMFCDTICWNELELEYDPDYVCGDPPGPEATVEYLDCVCGQDQWKTECGSGDEEGIEAGTLAICRAIEGELPEGCLEYDVETSATPIPTSIGDGQDEANPDFLREGATTVVVVVTDEGDGSPRTIQGDADIDPWMDLFEEFPSTVRFAVIGPPWDGSDASCVEGAATWGVERYQNIAAESGGTFIELFDLEDDCAATDVSKNLEKIGELLSTLVTLFELQQTPDISTIDVWVDDVHVAEAEVLSGDVLTGDAEYGDGWTYEAAYNAVQFRGAAIPDYNSDVRIYYEPLGGTPRELPF